MKIKRFGACLNTPVSPLLREKIEQTAQSQGLSMAELVRDLLQEGLKAKGF
ncbi:MAG: hypothetical protein LUQ59_11785 [Methanothrix sp.]|jgi:hypothetical protein|nr:hypothetical protein [Methanothrix sp.]